MSDSKELMDVAVKNRSTIAGMWYGLVCAPLPANEDGELFVIIPDIDPDTRWGPCFWSNRSFKIMVDVAETADTGLDTEPPHLIEIARVKLPTIGSECLVIFDNRQNIWVAQWE